MARVDGQTKQSQTGRRCVGATESVIYICALVVKWHVLAGPAMPCAIAIRTVLLIVSIGYRPVLGHGSGG